MKPPTAAERAFCKVSRPTSCKVGSRDRSADSWPPGQTRTRPPKLVMLTMPFTRRRLRHTGCATLLAWMFALLSGMANACLAQPIVQGGYGSLASQTDRAVEGNAGSVTRQVEHTHHPDQNDGEVPGDDGAQNGCLKFCADEASALPKSRAPQSDVPGPCFVASMQLPLLARIAAAAATAQAPVEPLASVGPPLFIRLLRLTI